MEEISDSNCGNNCHDRVINNCVYSQKYKGVVRQHNGHWGAQIYTNNNRYWLGTFKYENDAAIAYDRASIKLRSPDAPRNFLWSKTIDDLEATFQSTKSMDAILTMIKDGSYQSKFNEFRRKITDKENYNDLSVQKSCGSSPRLLFEKELTISDVGKLNRLVIPKRYAVTYFPAVPDHDQSEGSVNDDMLTFYDVNNKKWEFRYCYWKSSQSFVFTRGWNQFVKEKGLVAKNKIYFHHNDALGLSMITTCWDEPCLSTQVKCLESKEDEGMDQVVQANNKRIREDDDRGSNSVNKRPKGFKLFGVQIA